MVTGDQKNLMYPCVISRTFVFGRSFTDPELDNWGGTINAVFRRSLMQKYMMNPSQATC